MLTLWSMFLVLAILFFQEPDRSHLFVDKNSYDGNTEEDIISTNAPAAATVATDLTTPTSITNDVSETRPLVISGDLPLLESGGDSELSVNNESIKTKVEPPLWRNAAVMNSLWLYFVLKLVLEMLLSSTPTVTKYYFGWHSKISGLFMMIMALLMFPANLLVARLSQRHDDRELMFWSLLMMMVSVLGILDYGRNYSAIQYVVFAIGIFISTNCLEGPNMGLLSKTIPKSWAKGTFNSGFLATEAGTLARSVGDVLISAVAGSLGVSLLLNGLFVSMSALVVVSLLLVRRFYNQLTEGDDDDSTSIASLSMDESDRNN
jgi:Na+/melibiose symporter-like transporter